MKYLIQFYIMFLLLGMSTNSSAMSLEKIEGLTIQKTGYELFNRMGKTCDLKHVRKPLRLSNLICEDGNPTMSELESELTKLKSELVAVENARIAEKARTMNIKSRLKALKHRNVSMSKILKVVNSAAWMRDNISLIDHTMMEFKIKAIEAQDLIEEENYQVQLSEEKILKSAKTRIKDAKCQLEASQTAKDVCTIIQGRL